MSDDFGGDFGGGDFGGGDVGGGDVGGGFDHSVSDTSHHADIPTHHHVEPPASHDTGHHHSHHDHKHHGSEPDYSNSLDPLNPLNPLSPFSPLNPMYTADSGSAPSVQSRAGSPNSSTRRSDKKPNAPAQASETTPSNRRGCGPLVLGTLFLTAVGGVARITGFGSHRSNAQEKLATSTQQDPSSSSALAGLVNDDNVRTR